MTLRQLSNTISIAAIIISAFLLLKMFVFDTQFFNSPPSNWFLARWTNTSSSLLNDHWRGLGGGIEYSVSADFCNNIIPSFVDITPTCAQLLADIRWAFDRWSEGNPAIRFVDVTDEIPAQLPPEDSDTPWIAYGAEIDFFALTSSQFPSVKNAQAQTTYGFSYHFPFGTNLRYMPGATMRDADVVFNIENCFFFDPNFRPGFIILFSKRCQHFRSVVLHEIGHALGLPHPKELPGNFFDITIEDDDEGTAAQPLDECTARLANAKDTIKLDSNAIMIPERRFVSVSGLSDYDIAMRDFLYPICQKAQTN